MDVLARATGLGLEDVEMVLACFVNHGAWAAAARLAEQWMRAFRDGRMIDLCRLVMALVAVWGAIRSVDNDDDGNGDGEDDVC